MPRKRQQSGHVPAKVCVVGHTLEQSAILRCERRSSNSRSRSFEPPPISLMDEDELILTSLKGVIMI